jgi:WD40 repeat protein
MWRYPKYIFFLCVILLSTLPVASAQGPQVRTVPVTGVLYGGVLSPDGQTLAVFENTEMHADQIELTLLPIRLVNLATGEEKLLIGSTDYASDVVFTSDGTKLISYHGNGYIFIWDIASAKEIKRIPAIPGGSRGMVLLPDDKTLITPTYNQILVWDLDTGYVKAIWINRASTLQAWKAELSTKPAESFYQEALSPDGKLFATQTIYDNIWLWDTTTGEKTVLYESGETVPMLGFSGIAFTPDGKSVVYLNSDDGALHVLDVATGSESQVIPINAGRTHFALSPDGSTLAWIDKDAVAVKLINMAQPDNVTTVTLPTENTISIPPTTFLEFSPDSRQLVVGGLSMVYDDGKNEAFVIDLQG